MEKKRKEKKKDRSAVFEGHVYLSGFNDSSGIWKQKLLHWIGSVKTKPLGILGEVRGGGGEGGGCVSCNPADVPSCSAIGS